MLFDRSASIPPLDLLAAADAFSGPADHRRLELLRRYGIIDTPEEAEFDEIVGLASQLLATPTALISFVEIDRQWFKAKVGLDACETSSEVSFCKHAMAGGEVLVVPDATLDPRFASNPLVTGAPGIRFYCGAPLRAPCGTGLGALCAIDFKPRPEPGPHVRAALQSLAKMVMDRLERRRAEGERDEAKAQLAVAAAVPTAPTLFLDGDRIARATGGALELLRTAEHDLVGRSLCALVEDLTYTNDAWRHPRALDRAGQSLDAEIELRRPDGTDFPAALTIRPVAARAGTTAAATLRDLSELRRAEADVKRLSFEDALTALPNRAALEARIVGLMATALRGEQRVALLTLGLADFDRLSDHFGRAGADAVLRVVGARLRAQTDPNMLVARTGDARFTVLIDDAPECDAVEVLCQRLSAAVGAPIDLGEATCFAKAHIGIALYPDQAKVIGLLARHAEIARGRAEAAGIGHAVFDQHMDRALRRRAQLERGLREAIEDRAFELRFQPKYSVDGTRMTGAEALLRWRDAGLGVVSPVDFIPVAETTGLILPIGEQVLRMACSEAAQWAHMPVSVNLSPVQFRQGDLIERITRILATTGLPASRLELELTEGALIEDQAGARATLDRLKALGIKLALDDFGTGYASLEYLRLFPFDRVKLDRSFTSGIERSAECTAIVRAFLELSRGLGLASTAEGVETEAQLDYLDRFGCSEIQGYLLGAPMPADALRTRIFGAKEPLATGDAIAQPPSPRPTPSAAPLSPALAVANG